jgi:hypothetical protein
MTLIQLEPIPLENAGDVSPRVHELMQRIDRLPPGTYEITIEKPEVKAGIWQIEIVRTERIDRLSLSKYAPE